MIDFLRELLGETLRAPRAAARRLIGLGLDPGTVLAGFGVVVTASALFAWLSVAATPVPTGGAVEGPALMPFGLAAVQAGSILFLAAMVTLGGRAFGGKGRFIDALLLAVWLEFILVLLQIAQFAVMLVFPFSSILILLAGVALFLWLLTCFVAELHGFSSLVGVFFGILGGFLVAGFLASLLIVPQLVQTGI